MKLMSFAEINDLENGQQISALKGKITKVYDQLTGEGQYGTWWLQSIMLQDDHANELKITWSGEDPFAPNEWEGHEIMVESGRDKKDQLAGIKREIKNKNGKKYESVKVDDRATIQRTSNNATPQYPPQNDPKGGMVDSDWPEAERPKPSMLDERQRAIIRQHSQSMALEVLKLKVELKELTVEDLTPSKLKSLADYFDSDVLSAAS